jgi:cytochrome b
MPAKDAKMTMKLSVRVWDLPTRLFHWLLVALMGLSWWSAENDKMDWHRLSGSVLLGLISFRIIWGLIGSNTARFAAFLRSPRKVFAYLRSPACEVPHAGHNPIGGYSVLVMLGLILLQVVTGLFAVDVDGIESGQLSHLVDFDQGRLAAEVHEVSFTALQIVVAIHVAAILFYAIVRKRNLVRPMLTGSDAQVSDAHGALVPASHLRLGVSLAVAVAIGWWTAAGFPI